MTEPSPPDAPASPEPTPLDLAWRNAAIRDLANVCGWSVPRLARVFGRSRRQVRRIALRQPGSGPAEVPDDLTPAEIETMLRELAVDPYISVEERDQARAWVRANFTPTPAVAGSGRLRGIADFGPRAPGGCPPAQG